MVDDLRQIVDDGEIISTSVSAVDFEEKFFGVFEIFSKVFIGRDDVIFDGDGFGRVLGHVKDAFDVIFIFSLTPPENADFFVPSSSFEDV